MSKTLTAPPVETDTKHRRNQGLRGTDTAKNFVGFSQKQRVRFGRCDENTIGQFFSGKTFTKTGKKSTLKTEVKSAEKTRDRSLNSEDKRA